jgi:hypothetical protein
MSIGKSGHLSTYPNGFKHGIALDGEPLHRGHSGKVFYVGDGNSGLVDGRKGASNGNKGTFMDPFLTLNYAAEQLVSDRGDVIKILPGTVLDIETVVDIEANGVRIEGMGFGASRAQITPGVDNALDVEGDDVVISNLYFNESDAETAKTAIDVVGANFVLADCLMDLGATSDIPITVTATGERPTFVNNEFFVTADGTESIVKVEGVVDGLHWDNNKVVASVAALDEGIIDAEANAITNTYLGKTINFGGSTLLLATADVGTQYANPVGLRTTFCGATEDTAESVIADVTGNVEIWGVVGHIETAIDSESDVGVEADGNAVDLIVSTEGIGDELTAVRDVLYTTSGGGTALELQASADMTASTDGIWPAPVAVTAGAIVTDQSGTAGAGAFDWLIYWTPGPDGGNVADE